MKEKKIRKTHSKKDVTLSQRRQEIANKLEKEGRKIQAENNKLKEENRKLRNRVNDLVTNKDTNLSIYQTVQTPGKMNNSLVVPLNGLSPQTSKNKGSLERQNSLGSFKCIQSRLDGRATSYKKLPTYNDILKKEKNRVAPKYRNSFQVIKASSMIFKDHRRSNSNDIVIGDLDHGSCKYCESCKYRYWRKKMLTYEPIDLVNNRDLIRSIKCLACEKNYEIKSFIDH